jgi:hypothetical protein
VQQSAGLVLIVAGILCLCLSGVFVQGWWEGTLQAFGVGFVVGGIVDVLAISGLNQLAAQRQSDREIAAAAEVMRRTNYEYAKWILSEPRDF